MEKMCNVKNRGAGYVVYRIPEEGIRRSFAPGEVKRVSFDELEKLTYQSGGMTILTKYLQIQDEEVIRDFNMQVEPEYHMSETDVANLIRTGSLDAFLDALDFAPESVIDLIKKYSIELPLTDMNKRKALKQKTGFDVSRALEHIREEQTESEVNTDASSSSGRRTTTNYKVVAKKEDKTE